MSTKTTSTTLQKAADDEPIFVLRAQDFLAPAIVEEWARSLLEHKGDPVKIESALKVACDMRRWRTRNRHKIPD